jgi:soluble lytic murein transglycosylase
VSRPARRVGPLVAVGAFVLIFVLAATFARERARRVPDLSRWTQMIEASADEFEVDPNLVRGLMAAESGGDPDARSPAGAVGLLQLMPATAREQAERLGLKDYREGRLPEPALNIRLGTSYLARLLRRFEGEEAFALASYNAGATPVRRWRERAPDLSARAVILREGYEETRTHMERVFLYRDEYRRLYPSVR